MPLRSTSMCGTLHCHSPFQQLSHLNIVIGCYYNAQCLLYLTMRDASVQRDSEPVRVLKEYNARIRFNMMKGPKWNTLRMVKADGIQGLEFDLVVVDVTLGEMAGFPSYFDQVKSRTAGPDS
ncbi:uncharacterized protein PV06_09578 [Exophiala oligosperma]|uniref:Uncharacterized protein n=1 Tax=Exophiala oligosperma TaxID=215243 RepID=A0A0D2AEP3_9EURO|nr:uncharacterized protein PV06_09578 [Exophiala oligosperma]KIW38626.1 hypothetical protein PV06_09578 [Exophiala oligosperma]